MVSISLFVIEFKDNLGSSTCSEFKLISLVVFSLAVIVVFSFAVKVVFSFVVLVVFSFVVLVKGWVFVSKETSSLSLSRLLISKSNSSKELKIKSSDLFSTFSWISVFNFSNCFSLLKLFVDSNILELFSSGFESISVVNSFSNWLIFSVFSNGSLLFSDLLICSNDLVFSSLLVSFSSSSI